MATYHARKLTIVKGADTYIIKSDISASTNTRVWYGTCNTAASTQTKALAIENEELTYLRAGDIFVITFANAQSYNGNPKLDINSLGAGNIKVLTGKNAQKDAWAAGECVVLAYDGEAFVIINAGPVKSTRVTEDAVTGCVTVHAAMVNHEERLSNVENGLAKKVETINGVEADENGNVDVIETKYARQIVTDDAQQSSGEFIFRTTGGDASLSAGPAKLVSIQGRSIHTGVVEEVLDMVVNAQTRPTPAAITATIDNATFEAYVEVAGEYDLLFTTSWSADPTLYGITVTGTPVNGDAISIVWDGESTPEMTVNTVTRYPDPEITATLNKETFRAYVASSATITLSYTNAWSADPVDYGVTVTNTPISGDSIVITYVKASRGTITVSTPNKLISTGWNLYDDSTGKKYAKVKKYSDTYGFMVGGAYTALEFSETLEGSRTTITPVDNKFNISADGYVFVTGGDNTTYIFMTWSDWTNGYEGDFAAYTESTIDLAPIMTNFTNGLMQVGAVVDEIDFGVSRAVSRIERLTYSAANIAYAESSGRAYDADENYIYLVKETEDIYTISETGDYTASDHGVEIIEGTTVPVYVSMLYGQNLVDKLRTLPTDPVTISGTQNIIGEKCFIGPLAVADNQTSPSVSFQGRDNNGNVLLPSGSITCASAGTLSGAYGNAYFEFYEFAANSDGTNRHDYFESYSLPTPSNTITADRSYAILTSKNAVTVAQGGTGATTAADALANLGAAADNVVVKLTGDQTVDGKKIFKKDITLSHTSSRYKYINFGNSVSTCGFIRYDTGSGTNVSAGQLGFFEYSPKSTADTGTTGFAERYFLPNAKKGLAADVTYYILTDKSAVTVAQGGTGATTAADALENLGALSTTGTAAAATKLATARSLYVALGTDYNSSSPVTFNGTAAKALPVNGTLAINHGGSGQTAVSSPSTNPTTANGVNAYCYKWGKVVFIYVTGTNSATLNADTTILTIPSGYRPANHVYVLGAHSNFTISNSIIYHINTSGQLSSTINIASGAIKMSCCYLIS